MNQHDAKQMYQEAGRLFAEKRYADAIQLFDQLAEAFPTNASIVYSQTKCLAMLDRHDEARSAAQFLRDTLNDPRGEKLLQTLPQEASVPPELPTPPKEPKSRRYSAIALALVIIGGIGAAGYFFLLPGEVDSDETISSKAEVERVVVEEPTPPATPPAVSAKAVPDANFVPPEFELMEPRSGLENMIDFPSFDFTPEDEEMIAAAVSGSVDRVGVLIAGNAALANASAPIERRRKTPLSVAARNGNLTMVKLLLSNDAETDPEITDYGWGPPLGEAIREGHTDVVKELIEAGADVNGITYSESSNRPIHVAAWQGRTDMIEILLNAGVDIDSRDGSTGETALMIGCMSGQLNVVEFALAKGADVNAVSSQGNSPLHNASRGFFSPMELRTTENHIAIASVLIKNGANLLAKNEKGQTPQKRAQENDLPEVAALLAGDASAIETPDASQQLIAALADDDTARIAAALESDPELANAKLSGSMRGRTPLFLARSAEIAKQLVEAGATPSGHDDDGILLLGACDPIVLQSLVDGGGQVNETGPNGWTPLHWASLNGSIELVLALMDLGADPNLQTDASETVLAAAVRGGHTAIVDKLLAKGTDVNGPEGTYSAALMELLSNSENAEILASLLDAGALVNGQKKGSAPLHHAAFKKPQFVQTLLDRGADVSMKNDKGQTPFEIATARGHDEVLPLLDPKADAPTTTAMDKTPGEILIEIVKAGDVNAAVELLRDNRELSNTLDFENRPVLTHAKSVEMAELLVEAGADAEVSSVGWTPLMWIAGRNGSPEVAEYLIKQGAWVSIEDDNGARPIHQAAFMGNHDLVQILVANGADINAIDDAHATPLHGAAWSGDLDGAKMYLSLGADPSLENKKGATPYDLAQSRENEDLLPVLNPEQIETSHADVEMTDDTQVGTAGTRELNFPDDIKLGTLQIRDWASTDYKAWESAGSAWGTVSVPVGKEVMLMVDMPRLESLNSVDPEGIQVIHIRNLKLADDQLEYLYRLKGLQKLTLSKTGVSKAAVDALRVALPECSVRH